MDLGNVTKKEDSSDPDSDAGDEDPADIKRRAQRVSGLLSHIFPYDDAEEFIIHHVDLNTSNVLVGEDDELNVIIDWECVHTVPLWYACQMPNFLDAGVERHESPNPDDFLIYTQDDSVADRNEMYYRHLKEHENAQLWKFFLDEMHCVCPEWVQTYKGNQLKAGFEDVVSLLGQPMTGNVIDKWLDRVEKYGTSPSTQNIRRKWRHNLDGC